MSTLTLTLDDSPEARLFVAMLKTVSFVRHLEEAPLPNVPVHLVPYLQPGNAKVPSLLDSVVTWPADAPSAEELRHNTWARRWQHQQPPA